MNNPISELKSHLSDIEKNIHYRFKDQDLLVLALVHRSFVNENRDLITEHNERLEFLGDSVLGLVIANYLYQKYPDYPEGKLSFLKAYLVDAQSCFQFLKKLSLDNYVLLGKGEKTAPRGKESIFSDVFEAIVGAIYLDGGLKKVEGFIEKNFSKDLEIMIEHPLRNYKAELQDYTQKKLKKIPVYRCIKEEGPDHQKVFTVCAYVEENILGEGCGSSKKDAEQAAAKNALQQIKENNG